MDKGLPIWENPRRLAARVSPDVAGGRNE